VSIGGGALYSNLSLEVSATSLKLNVATGSITFQRWYEQAPFALPRVRYLQLVIEGTKNYAPSSSDPMRNRKIQYFDFEGLVADFDAARAAGQGFSVADNLQNHRIWGSDSDAMGGALAYQYARTGSVGALSWDQMRAVIGDAAFGNAAQPIVALAAAASGDAESVALEEASVAIEPAMLAAANESSEPNDVLQLETNGAGKLKHTGTIRLGELPAAWFMPKPLSQSAAAHAVAWRRIARELPAHLDHAAAWDGAPPFADGVRVNPQSAIGVRVTFDGGIGLRDSAALPLRNFEGLREGLSLLA